jgi:hypothetical protein
MLTPPGERFSPIRFSLTGADPNVGTLTGQIRAPRRQAKNALHSAGVSAVSLKSPASLQARLLVRAALALRGVFRCRD